jgi:hypothetical protein
MPKTSDPFVKTNEELTKAQTTGHTAETWREQPKRQAPGGMGHGKPDFERWSDEELLAHARGLGAVAADETPERDELIRRLDETQTRGQ